MEKIWPYRFKTEKEMIKEFGDEWWTKMNWAFGQMDYLLGITFEHKPEAPIDFIQRNYIGHFRFGHTSWTIESCMLTSNVPVKPNYKPKVFVRN